MRLKKIIISLLATIALQVLAMAQHHPNPQAEQRKEKIEALKIAYITKELSLTPEEAQVFWPVYNEYQNKQEMLRKEFRQKFKKPLSFETDKEAEDFLAADIKFRQDEMDLMKIYYEKMKKVLPIKKVAKLRHAEESFRQELLKQVKRKMEE